MTHSTHLSPITAYIRYYLNFWCYMTHTLFPHRRNTYDPVCVLLFLQMGIYQHAANMRRFLVFIGIVSCLPLAYVMSGRLQPYSSSNPITPKRLFMIVSLMFIFLFILSYQCNMFACNCFLISPQSSNGLNKDVNCKIVTCRSKFIVLTILDG